MRIIRILQLTLLLPVLFSFVSKANGQEIFGKAKYNYRSFADKKTMVVVNQQDFTDLSLADAVKSGWKLSLYELCNQERFSKLMTDTNYFFLLRVEGKMKREGEASLEYLTLVKGGPSAKKGIDKMYEIVSMPLQPIDDESGKAFVFMPVLINIMQDHIINVGESILRAYVGNSFYSNRIDNIGDRVLLIDKGDIGWNYSDQEMKDLFGDNIVIGDASQIARAVKDAEEKRVVSYTVSPAGAKSRGFSYKMLIDVETHELLFFRRHRISQKSPAGFTEEDLKRISNPYRTK
ncbi:MAG: hypothetical protein QMB82_02870 [Bacteroidales bacterium]